MKNLQKMPYQIVAANETVMVQYMASWCENGRLMKSKFKKLPGEHKEIKNLL